MPQVSWTSAAYGRYWIDVAVGNHAAKVMIDLGLVDSKDLVGFELDPLVCDFLKRSGELTRIRSRYHRDANGQLVRREIGQAVTQLIDPVAQQPVGPVVRLYVSRGVHAVASRVGVVFFHRLAGCRVIWDLGARVWCVEYP